MNTLNRKLAALCVLALSAGVTATAQDEEKIDFNPESFRLEVTYMTPLSYQARVLNHDYYLELKNDSANVYMPYMGNVHTPQLYDEGLDFKLPVESKKVKYNKKKKSTTIDFSVRRAPVVYDFTVTVYNNGEAYINVMPSHAQSISYNANIEVSE